MAVIKGQAGTALAFGPDGKVIASGGKDGSIGLRESTPVK